MRLQSASRRNFASPEGSRDKRRVFGFSAAPVRTAVPQRRESRSRLREPGHAGRGWAYVVGRAAGRSHAARLHAVNALIVRGFRPTRARPLVLTCCCVRCLMAAISSTAMFDCQRGMPLAACQRQHQLGKPCGWAGVFDRFACDFAQHFHHLGKAVGSIARKGVRLAGMRRRPG